MITLQVPAGDTANRIIDTAQTAANTLSTAPKELHFIDLLFAGGWVMIPLALLAFLGLVIFIERYLTIRKSSKDESNLMFQIKQNIHEGRLESAIALCKNTKSPLARMLEKG
jgi:biopolymer transport protein ExbB